jgi:hypothetical protein
MRKKLVLCTRRCERVADFYLTFASRDHHRPPDHQWKAGSDIDALKLQVHQT